MFERACNKLSCHKGLCEKRAITSEVSHFITPIPYAADGEDLLECLAILQLSGFVNFTSSSDLFSTFLNTSGDSQFTIFVPTNAAFEAMREELEDAETEVSLDTLVGHHIIPDSELKESDLGFNLRFNTLANTTLHTAVVVYGDRTLVYNPQYSNRYHSSNLVRYTTVSQD